MRKTYKQWLAAVLCLVCMWAMAPAGAGAEEEAYYPFALPGCWRWCSSTTCRPRPR